MSTSADRLIKIDPYLEPYKGDIDLRMKLYRQTRKRLLGEHKDLSSYANGHLYFGFHQQDGGWYYREWAPHAQALALIGDFNGWDRGSHKLTALPGGVWELFIPGADALPHGSRVKVEVQADGKSFDRIPLYCTRVVQDPETLAFDGQVWCPSQPFAWTDRGFKRRKRTNPLIYECHIGISGENLRVATFAEFTAEVLPRVRKLGYNTIQLMAIMEHPYYGSFGYQVSNFFAVSSRFGTPEELKELINTAHGMGISVLLDLVHSHAASNELEGIARFDGTDYQFFHKGPRGTHPAWGSKLFDYAKAEVLHFLLSNIKFWLEEYHLDGFRFDGVTSMLYHDHGLGGVFDNYQKYFSLNTDTQAVTYLQLAAELSKEINPKCILIAEDMSGMPGMCIPLEDAGIGFDYRLSMGMPDFWVQTLKRKRDEDWNMGQLWHELNQRRPREKVIGYCESHDQALVGDKTIMFWLADQEMYWHMDKGSQSLPIDRAIALHKMIRLITGTCSGDGYLNFMGNEFGHPEWIDFPREGNGWSYHYARRLWSLVDNPQLRYQFLYAFDHAMITLLKKDDLLCHHSRLLLLDEGRKLVAYTKDKYLFLFNFHPQNDTVAEVDLEGPQQYRLRLHSNWHEFGGYMDKSSACYQSHGEGGRHRLDVTLYRRSALVLECK